MPKYRPSPVLVFVAINFLLLLGGNANSAVVSRTLKVVNDGSGAGNVLSSPAGVNCGQICAKKFARGTVVTLVATSTAYSRFAGWSGNCSGTSSCALTMNSDKTVIATFVTRVLRLTKTGAGSGHVTSDPAGVSCTTSCVRKFLPGTAITLTATPSTNSRFVGWSGACTGTASCRITMTGERSVTAKFGPKFIKVNTIADAVDASPGDGYCATVTGACSLRAAIQEANALPGADTVGLPPGVFSLSIAGSGEENASRGDLDIRAGTNLIGWSPEDTIIDGGALDNVLDIRGASYVSGVTLRNAAGDGIRHSASTLIVNNAEMSGNSFGYHDWTDPPASPLKALLNRSVIKSNSAGGVINNYADVRVYDTTISNNVGDFGGGIRTATRKFAIENSTISGNSAIGSGLGGGIHSCGDLSLSNVTISGNTANDSGGGLFISCGTVALNNVTVAGNAASGGASGIFQGGGGYSLKVKNSIVANNMGTPNCGLFGTNSSLGNNLVSDRSCGLTLSSDRFGLEPLLGPLRDNGGFTFTHAPLAASPVIDRGSSKCIATDQRNITRPRGLRCDIGAVEAGSAPHKMPLNLFNLEVGNRWSYRDATNKVSSVEVQKLDGDTLSPKVIYVIRQKEGTRLIESDWFEVTPSEVRLWGGTVPLQGRLYSIELSRGLPVAWYPLTVGTQKLVSAQASIADSTGTITQTAKVVSKEELSLSFGTVNAYRIHYVQTIRFSKMNEVRGFTYWLIPSAGIVAISIDETPANVKKLTSFVSRGGFMTQTTDTDRDGVKDYQDNCILIANPNQRDNNHNDLGDACE